MKKKPLINYYATLKVSSQVKTEELRQAYLKMVKIYHPDRNKGRPLAEEKFQQINLAWEALKDPVKRKKFDLKLKTQKEQRVALLKARQKKPAGKKEIDLEVPLKLSFEDICQLKKKKISYFRSINGLKEKSFFELKVPQGVQKGTRLRFKGKGGSEALEPYGDLYVKIKIRSHKLFKTLDKPFDLMLEQPVSIVSSFLDTKLSSLSPYGVISLEVLPPLENQQILRAEGFGLIKNEKGEKGDLFIKILIDYPLNKALNIKEELKKLPLEGKKSYVEALAKDSLIYPKILKFEKKIQEIKLKYYRS